MAFNAQWKPGPEAAAAMHKIGPDLASLVVYMDPDSLALMPPADPEQWPSFIGLMQQLSTGAEDVATFLKKRQWAALNLESGISQELPGIDG